MCDSLYCEMHHIIPRSEGGSDEPSNIVALTAREHFLAHWLLYRAAPYILSRAFSFWRMCNGRGKVSPENWITISSRSYEEARVAHSHAISQKLSNRKKSPEHVAKVAKANTGKKRSEESKLKMSLAKKGRPLSETHRQNMKGRIPWNKGIPAALEVREKLSRRLLGNTFAAKPCVVNGTHYDSIKSASLQEGIPLNTVKNRLRSGKRSDYYYL